ncbi:Plasmodium exported protein, unknown function [Plasmodium malariae]|uniref:Pv-fam-b protein n=1 Tax=Plasmodium malariae TaxID=5858 RepID=A0A1D3JKZ9_PLAMA|nr:Plasmodium exported protein, unknown function [Plasmodium malariae]SBT87277.1 Plasmodium exported protein, unknown function [Plasmodium malariae]
MEKKNRFSSIIKIFTFVLLFCTSHCYNQKSTYIKSLEGKVNLENTLTIRAIRLLLSENKLKENNFTEINLKQRRQNNEKVETLVGELESTYEKNSDNQGKVNILKKLDEYLEEKIFNSLTYIYSYFNKNEKARKKENFKGVLKYIILLNLPSALVSLLGFLFYIGKDNTLLLSLGTAACIVINLLMMIYVFLKNLKYKAIQAGYKNPSFKVYIGFIKKIFKL